jgi:DNA end-binding protein Ku
MAARAIWKATLDVGPARLGVKLYSAVQEHAIRFHLLHRTNQHRVRQRLADPRTGATVEPEQVRRGVEIERGTFVTVDEDEVSELDPSPSKHIVVERFVPVRSIDRLLYDRPYWLGPDGDVARYFALVKALDKRGREGIARWVLRNREYVGALRVEQGFLVLVTLRHADEILATRELPAPTGRPIDERERKLGRQLMETLSGDFDPSEFHEEYRERVLDLIASKRKGKRIRLQHFTPKRTREADLAAALQKSLRKAA